MRHKTLPRYSSRPIRQRPDLRTPPGPRASTLKTILDYSKALTVVDAPPLGKVDVILN
jgi:hypothetical protein